MISIQKIDELANGITYHVNSLSNLIKELKETNSLLADIKSVMLSKNEHQLEKLTQNYENIKLQLEKHGMPIINEYEQNLQTLKRKVDSEEWPVAVNPDSICFDDSDFLDQAIALINLFIKRPLARKKCLEIGKKNYFLLEELEKEQATSYGFYDNADPIKPNQTSDISQLKKWDLFDIVIINEYLDSENIDAIKTLELARSSLNDDGTIFLRCNPWLSRHGGEFYETVNKAFLQLFFDPIEMVRIFGIDQKSKRYLYKPLDCYRNWIKMSNLEIMNETVLRTKVEDFFIINPELLKKVLLNFENVQEALDNMSIDFVEYELKSVKEIDVI